MSALCRLSGVHAQNWVAVLAYTSNSLIQFHLDHCALATRYCALSLTLPSTCLFLVAPTLGCGAFRQFSPLSLSPLHILHPWKCVSALDHHLLWLMRHDGTNLQRLGGTAVFHFYPWKSTAPTPPAVCRTISCFCLPFDGPCTFDCSD